jgi:hypothetical protein
VKRSQYQARHNPLVMKAEAEKMALAGRLLHYRSTPKIAREPAVAHSLM